MASTKVKKIEDSKETINVEEIKKELKDYITIEIKNGFNEELEKSNKRLIREKNKKILSKNITIIVLSLIIIFLLYLLYNDNYFNKYFVKENDATETIKKEENSETTKEEEKVKEETLDEKIAKYSYLMDYVFVNENSDYFKDYSSGSINTQIKNYITLNSLKKDKIISEEDYSIISEEDFKNAYENIFNDEYSSKSFNYNETEIKYVSVMKSYISDSVIKVIDKNDGIDRIITNIDVNENKVVITTLESGKFDGESKIFSLKFTFDNNKLVSIEK